MNYIPPTLQAQIDAIHTDADLECCWAESMEECQQIIAKGQKKIVELLSPYDFRNDAQW